MTAGSLQQYLTSRIIYYRRVSEPPFLKYSKEHLKQNRKMKKKFFKGRRYNIPQFNLINKKKGKLSNCEITRLPTFYKPAKRTHYT